MFFISIFLIMQLKSTQSSNKLLNILSTCNFNWIYRDIRISNKRSLIWLNVGSRRRCYGHICHCNRCKVSSDEGVVQNAGRMMWRCGGAALRLMRRRLVLAVIFVSSLSYCIISLLRDVSFAGWGCQPPPNFSYFYIYRSFYLYVDWSNFLTLEQ